MVDAGVPKEHARMVLPLGTRVNCTVSMNLRSFFHLLEIRGAGDAQGEINYLTYNMAQAFASVYPDLAEIYFEHSFMKPKRLSP
jgi:thymidylate synthase (FAD)